MVNHYGYLCLVFSMRTDSLAYKAITGLVPLTPDTFKSILSPDVSNILEGNSLKKKYEFALNDAKEEQNDQLLGTALMKWFRYSRNKYVSSYPTRTFPKHIIAKALLASGVPLTLELITGKEEDKKIPLDFIKTCADSGYHNARYPIFAYLYNKVFGIKEHVIDWNKVLDYHFVDTRTLFKDKSPKSIPSERELLFKLEYGLRPSYSMFDIIYLMDTKRNEQLQKMGIEPTNEARKNVILLALAFDTQSNNYLTKEAKHLIRDKQFKEVYINGGIVGTTLDQAILGYINRLSNKPLLRMNMISHLYENTTNVDVKKALIDLTPKEFVEMYDPEHKVKWHKRMDARNKMANTYQQEEANMLSTYITDIPNIEPIKIAAKAREFDVGEYADKRFKLAKEERDKIINLIKDFSDGKYNTNNDLFIYLNFRLNALDEEIKLLHMLQ